MFVLTVMFQSPTCAMHLIGFTSALVLGSVDFLVTKPELEDQSAYDREWGECPVSFEIRA